MSELTRVFDGKEYKLYAKTMESKNRNPKAQQIKDYIKKQRPNASVRIVGGRVYVRF